MPRICWHRGKQRAAELLTLPLDFPIPQSFCCLLPLLHSWTMSLGMSYSCSEICGDSPLVMIRNPNCLAWLPWSLLNMACLSNFSVKLVLHWPHRWVLKRCHAIYIFIPLFLSFPALGILSFPLFLEAPTGSGKIWLALQGSAGDPLPCESFCDIPVWVYP